MIETTETIETDPLAGLVALPLAPDDPPGIAHSCGDAAIGWLADGKTAQLDILYRDGRTIVYPSLAPAKSRPWAFAGKIDAHLCLAWLLANMP